MQSKGETVISGIATVIAPIKKVKRKRIELPKIEFKASLKTYGIKT